MKRSREAIALEFPDPEKALDYYDCVALSFRLLPEFVGGIPEGERREEAESEDGRLVFGDRHVCNLCVNSAWVQHMDASTYWPRCWPRYLPFLYVGVGREDKNQNGTRCQKLTDRDTLCQQRLRLFCLLTWQMCGQIYFSLWCVDGRLELRVLFLYSCLSPPNRKLRDRGN
jgi:hypothetical protein